MATHSSILVWRIPGMGKPGGLQSMGSHRVGYDWSDLAAAAAAAAGTSRLTVCSCTRPWTPGTSPSSTRLRGCGWPWPHPGPSYGCHVGVLHQAKWHSAMLPASVIADLEPSLGVFGFHQVLKKWKEARNFWFFCLKCCCYPGGLQRICWSLLGASPLSTQWWSAMALISWSWWNTR